MKSELEPGTLMSGRKFTLPLDLVTRTLAIIGIRGCGKTVAATVLAEEMCEAGLPWVSLDPASVWWGLRVNPDGSPGGYPIVVVGGPHADLPLSRDMGAPLAEAFAQENICLVIDLKLESKNVWRKFVTDFCDRLMKLNPAVPRHIFIEEAPEFVPQKPMGEQRRSLAAVDRLNRLGRNNGYGSTLISQRYATIQKDVLTQCENLLALRSIGKPDRNTMRDWIAECVSGSGAEKQAEKFMASLTGLPDGTGWFWSPQWLDRFEQVRIRHRKTYHPGETRTVGQMPKQVALSDVKDFVERFALVLSKVPKAPSKRIVEMPKQPLHMIPALPTKTELVAAQQEASRLRAQVAEMHRQIGSYKSALEAVRKAMEPEYRALQKLFDELQAIKPSDEVAESIEVFEPWKKKLGPGPAKLIDCLIERGGELTRVQLQTLSGYGPRSMTTHISRLNSNGLIEKDGNLIRLRVP